MTEIDTPEIKALQHLAAYRSKLDNIYALGIESSMSLNKLSKEVEKNAKRMKRSDGIGAESRRMFYGHTRPDAPDATFQHVATHKEIINRTAHGGSHQKMLFQAAIVFAYMHWEDDCRSKFAKELSIEKNKITSDVFGDLGKYRNAIAHNNSILKRKSLKLNFVEVNSEIELNQNQFMELFATLISELNIIAETFTGYNSPFWFDFPTNS